MGSNGKKLIPIVLFLALVITVCSGCDQAKEETSIVLASDPVESYDNVSVYVPEGTETSEESDIGGIVAKDKTYTYGDTNVVLLNVENQTDKDYTLTINGTYLDRDGAVLKTETQTFCDFVSGYQGYFLFHPEMAFASFSYTFSLAPFEGERLLSNIKFLQWDKEKANFMVWQEQLIELAGIDDTVYNTLSTDYRFINDNDITLHIKRVMLAIDSNGEVISIKPFGYEKVSAHGQGGGTFRLYHTLDKLTTDAKTWPSHLQGELHLIMIPIDALTEEEYRSMVQTQK